MVLFFAIRIGKYHFDHITHFQDQTVTLLVGTLQIQNLQTQTTLSQCVLNSLQDQYSQASPGKMLQCIILYIRIRIDSICIMLIPNKK